MKIISLSILSIVLSLSLFARENPFEPTDQFLEQKELMIKKNQEEKIKQEKAEKEKVARELKEQKMAELVLAEKIMAEKVEKKTIDSQKTKTVQETKEKAYIPAIVENFKVLPFVKIHIKNDVLTIKVDPKYPLLNQDLLKPVKKFLFDFKGNVSFYSIRKDIVSEDYQSFAVGTHMEKNFFRVVINLTDEMIKYTETIDSKNGIITIKKNN